MNDWDKTLVVDLDQTLCELRKPGQDYLEVLPLPGAIEALQAFKVKGWSIIVHTARGMGSLQGNIARIESEVLPTIKKWLDKWGMPYDGVVVGKPLGIYVDDKAISFQNNWPEIVKTLL
jgi:capsule biosynthesis phosphatase